MRKRMTIAMTILVFMTGIGNASASDANKALVQRFIEATNTLDLDALDTICTADIVRHSPSTPGLVITNIDDFKAFLQQDAATFKGASVALESIVADNERVAVTGLFTGRHVGNVGPIAPTGIDVSMHLQAMFRIENERIAEFWVVWDNLALLAQLGHSPFGEPNENQDD